MRRILTLQILLVLILSTVFLINEGSEAEGSEEGPVFTVAMDEYMKNAKVAPGTNGIVTFYGNISCDFPDNVTNETYYTVSFSTSCDDWSVSSIPPVMLSKESNTSAFQVSVQVPLKTSSSKIGNLTIEMFWSNGTSLNESGILPPVFCKVKVEPYISIEIHGITYKESKKREWKEYDIIILNLGNSPVNITLEIDNQGDQPLKVEPMNTTITIPESNETTVTFRVRQEGGGSGSHYVLLKAISEDGEELSVISIYYRGGVEIDPVVIFIVSSLVIIGFIAVIFSIRKLRKNRQSD